ncbi:glycosyltransferase [Halalkalibacter krulwichiae]|uniref:N-acetylgalactosamine-N, N'-diacetylbacillosaminyl-diphospho-undecaprenol 4-alpha-N-acetylgalactosaminyltransferase n=1 Tax=Halalkalibacter krulwichiae TaxID=199441 RepID=A0A1X9MFJ5_9BACI|nr:glycosyltransferase [Halalkalibacter krulwichiae]ARK32218.1 N-acetylgalactosamine-N,N'-diacetylbacillosaminyl-diphospho-undecaprenol 4-alpha-N-acetylgalactosaminyltransferase [Halalkalibacter krulwichiae]
MKKVKILFFIYQMGGGGAARTLLNIINNLDRSKFEPYLVTLNFDGSYEKELKDDVKFIKLDTKRLSRSILRLAKIIKEEGIDVAFSTIPRVNTIAIIASKLSFSKVKSVIREADNLGGSLRENMQLLGFGMVYKTSDQIVSLSEGVKANLVNRYKVKPERIEVIYNPVDLNSINDKVEHGKIDPEHEALFLTDDKVIITAGRLVEQKDQRTLVKAFAKVNNEISSRLVILGEGPLKEELMELARELSVLDRVHFIGFQSNPYSYFTKADLFVLSSKHEGFSHVIAEALATGTPVVSTNCKSGPEEVLNFGEFGALCDVGNDEQMAGEMLKVLSVSEQERLQIIEKGYARARDFDAKQIVKQYEQLFLSTLSKQ